MSAPAKSPARPEHGNAYNIFILILTIASLLVMLLMLLPLPLSQETNDLLRVYDNAICVIFLIDFAINLVRSRPRRQYFIYERGWLDLIGSIPSFGFFPATGILRIARLSRLARIARLLQGNKKRELVQDVVQNRGQYAVFITLLSAMLVLSTASILVLQFESKSPDANITTGGDALWWGLVTITTVGYGDRFPVTPLGRATGVLVMFAGVGIIGALASILASILVPPAPDTSDRDEVTRQQFTATLADISGELAAVRAELAALRAGDGAGTGPPRSSPDHGSPGPGPAAPPGTPR